MGIFGREICGSEFNAIFGRERLGNGCSVIVTPISNPSETLKPAEEEEIAASSHRMTARAPVIDCPLQLIAAILYIQRLQICNPSTICRELFDGGSSITGDRSSKSP